MIFPWIHFGVTVNLNLKRIIQMLLMEELVEKDVLVQCVFILISNVSTDG